jgi:hypothetical protein
VAKAHTGGAASLTQGGCRWGRQTGC